MGLYHENIFTYEDELANINKKFNLISILRLTLILILLATIYLTIKEFQISLLIGAIITFGIFLLLVHIHGKLNWQKIFKSELLKINQQEKDCIEYRKLPFYSGKEFIDPKHFYSYDLDLFGDNSFYQHICRCGTFIGRTTLGRFLLSILPHEEIIKNQDAVKEVAEKLDWRQSLNAHANLANDSKVAFDKILQWKNIKPSSLHPFLNLMPYLGPLALITAGLLFFYTGNSGFKSLAGILFLVNIGIMSLVYKKITSEIAGFDQVHKILEKYSRILELIENENFNSVKLLELRNKLINPGETTASQAIHKLSKLFEQLDSVNNALGAFLINGISLYHLHILKNVYAWKNQNSDFLEIWLSVLGEIESFNSIGNYFYNNPDYIFPKLNEKLEIEFTELGHPLIPKEKRITNSISFSEKKIIILTGSNMSGKSTFLRTLGLNMVLGGMGAPLCAKSARIQPLKVMVAMRQSDSLLDNESYFFTEVKRIKSIFDELKSENGFVLLDEILKGTNSDDKQTGTIGVIEKLITLQAIGVVATHDLEVCNTTYQHGHYLANKCFEVELSDESLSFDYKLRDGICKNKSATYIMKKMDII